jgi:hypothetical protein
MAEHEDEEVAGGAWLEHLEGDRDLTQRLLWDHLWSGVVDDGFELGRCGRVVGDDTTFGGVAGECAE